MRSKSVVKCRLRTISYWLDAAGCKQFATFSDLALSVMRVIVNPCHVHYAIVIVLGLGEDCCTLHGVCIMYN